MNISNKFRISDKALMDIYQDAYGPAWERGEWQGAHIDGLRAILAWASGQCEPTPKDKP